LRSRKEIDNHVGDKLNEKSDIPPTVTTDDSKESTGLETYNSFPQPAKRKKGPNSY